MPDNLSVIKTDIMLTIRFSRVGRKNKAQFRIVLQERTAAPKGGHVEVLGSYDPHSKKSVLKTDKIKDWMSKGAQASDSVYNLLVREGIVEGKKRAVKMEKPKSSVAEPGTPEAPAEPSKAEPEEPKAEEVAAV